MKSHIFTFSLSVVFILGIIATLDVIGTNPVQQASAYVTTGCYFGSSTVTWRAGANLTSTYATDLRYAIADHNNDGTNVFFDEVTSGGNLIAYTWNHPETTARGVTFLPAGCSGSYGSSTVSVLINDPVVSGFTSQKRQATWSHELGHALGLDHPTGSGTNYEATNMKPTATSYDTYGIFYPVLDDIRGIASIYGMSTSTSQCNTSTQSGSVTYTGTCSSSNPALPMTEKVTTAGSSNRAFAYDSTTSLPSVGTILITSKVQPNTLFRFSTGVHTNTNVADGGSRYGTIEVDNDGFKAAWSFLGLTQTATISSSTPSTTTIYFLELVMQDGKSASAHVYQDNGGGSTPPTYIGKATFTPSGSWTGTKYTGTGVWTDSGSNPKSDYTVSQHFNKQKSYT
jgi:hypothetical protein